MITHSKLEPLSAFLAVAETGGFSAAARQLNVSTSAVSQAIRALEARAGVPLFIRTTRSVGLTEAGQRMHLRCGPAMEEIERAFSEAGKLVSTESGTLRINVPGIAVPLVIEPILADFCHAYPDINVEIRVDDGIADIISQRFDAGIRTEDMVDKDMVSVKLTPDIRWGIVASPSYLERAGIPKTPQDLKKHDCIQWRMQTSGALYSNWELCVNGEEITIPTEGKFTINDSNLMHRAARDGLGLCYTLEPSISDDLNAGHLVPVLEEFWTSEPGLSLYFPQGAQKLGKLRAFIDFAKAKLQM